jgi:hypothetical protein
VRCEVSAAATTAIASRREWKRMGVSREDGGSHCGELDAVNNKRRSIDPTSGLLHPSFLALSTYEVTWCVCEWRPTAVSVAQRLAQQDR